MAKTVGEEIASFKEFKENQKETYQEYITEYMLEKI